MKSLVEMEGRGKYVLIPWLPRRFYRWTDAGNT